MSAAKEKPRLEVVGSGAARRLVGFGNTGTETIPRDGPHWPEPRPVRRDLFELASAGFDENLQLIGGDPWGTSSWGGLRVPGVATPNYKRRYLFLLAWLRLDANRWGRVRGIRTSTLLGAAIASSIEGGPPYIVEREVENPFWKGPNGNVCFFMRRIPSPGQKLVRSVTDGPSVNYQYANGPALLYQSLSPYIPPGNGVPPGVALSPGLGAWYDGRFSRWRSESGWGSTDIAVQGPCDLGLFCSVYQMSQVKPVPPAGTLGLPPDDAFLMNFPTAQFWRVAGSFVWQEDTAL